MWPDQHILLTIGLLSIVAIAVAAIILLRDGPS